MASIIISFLSFIITSWRLQCKDYIAKDDSKINNNKVSYKGYKSFPSGFTYLYWTLTSIVIYSGSLVILSLLGYIEMFSSYLMESGFELNIHLLPFMILLVPIPVNLVLYRTYIQNKDSHSFAHALLSSIAPCR